MTGKWITTKTNFLIDISLVDYWDLSSPVTMGQLSLNISPFVEALIEM